MNHLFIKPFCKIKYDLLNKVLKINTIHKQQEGRPALLIKAHLKAHPYFLSHFWLATVHDVLHADWHDV